VREQRAERGRGGRRGHWLASDLGGRKAAREEADRGALDVAFDPGDLAGKADVRHGF
jgi:hypothetical protein